MIENPTHPPKKVPTTSVDEDDPKMSTMKYPNQLPASTIMASTITNGNDPNHFANTCVPPSSKEAQPHCAFV